MALYQNALTTVERVVDAIKMYPFLPEGLDLADPAVETQIARLINSWSELVEQATGTKLGFNRYTQFYRGTNQPSLILNNYPIKEIISFEKVNADGTTSIAYDVDKVFALTSADEFNRGMIYIAPNLPALHSTTGIVPDPYNSLKTYKIVYDAGYILPKDETDELPCDLPAALENLVVELVKDQFIASVDSIRANNLISLTEGNVQRVWGDPKDFKFNEAQKRILSLFKRKMI